MCLLDDILTSRRRILGGRGRTPAADASLPVGVLARLPPPPLPLPGDRARLQLPGLPRTFPPLSPDASSPGDRDEASLLPFPFNFLDGSLEFLKTFFRKFIADGRTDGPRPDVTVTRSTRPC